MNKKFYPSPFWAINDKLDINETKTQIKDILDHGFGGAFFHSRHGLITEYMSEEWFDNVRAAIDTAKENNGYVWLYDEDLFPSGNAGGKVAAVNDEMRVAQIRFEFVPKGEKPIENQGIFKCAYRLWGRRRNMQTRPLSAFLYTEPEPEIESFDIITEKQAFEETDAERIVVRKFYAPKTPWWSGESYSNMLNPEVTEKFIELTHEKYKAEIGNEFGKTVPGIFTDEPHLIPEFNAVPWWEGMPEKYRNDTGKDLWQDLPYMIFDHPKAQEARLLISRCITDQFVQAYDRQVYDWCEKNNLIFTGHYSAEDYFDEQLRYHMGGVMAHYRYIHIPGVDHLCRQTDGLEDSPNFNFNSYITVKQASSAAHQLGREQVMAEIWGVTAHNNPLGEYKHMGDVHIGLGATFFVPHLSWYSMKGRRKRDFPPVFNYQQTYWDDFAKITEYFGKVSGILTGERDVFSEEKPKQKPKNCCDILIIHTIESAVATRKLGFVPDSLNYLPQDCTVPENLPWDINCEDRSSAGRIEHIFRNTSKAVNDMGYECHYGDEDYIEDMGEVKGNIFAIGKAEYRIVIVPEAVTFRPSTINKLTEFAKSGGKVILLGKVADLCDGKRDNISMTDLLKLPNTVHIPQSRAGIQKAVSTLYCTDYTLTDKNGQWTENTIVTKKETEKGQLFFICNSDKKYTKEYILTLKNAKGRKLYIIDAANSRTETAKTNHIGNNIIFEFRLEKYDSKFLYIE